MPPTDPAGSGPRVPVRSESRQSSWRTRAYRAPTTGRGSRSPSLDHLVIAPGVRLADPGLRELSDAGLGYLGDERPALGQLPVRHLPVQEGPQLSRRDRCAGREHDGGQRPLAPPLARAPDPRPPPPARVTHQRVLQLHGGDPLATGLDRVLGPVGERDEAQPVDRPDVTGAQPAVAELLRVIVSVVGPGDPRSADLDLADRLAVVRPH